MVHDRATRVSQTQESHLVGILLITTTVVLGLVVTGSVLLMEREKRLAEQALVQASPVSEAPTAAPTAKPTMAPTAAPAKPIAASVPVQATEVSGFAGAGVAPVPTAIATKEASSGGAPTESAAMPTATTSPAPPKPTATPAAPAQATAPPPAPTGGSAAAGSAVYAASCAACHPNGKAGLGPAVVGLSEEEITRGVRDGKGMMPAFPASRLSDQQLLDIIAFLQSQ